MPSGKCYLNSPLLFSFTPAPKSDRDSQNKCPLLFCCHFPMSVIVKLAQFRPNPMLQMATSEDSYPNVGYRTEFAMRYVYAGTWLTLDSARTMH